MNKKVIVSVSNDLSTDQRVRKQCASLAAAGYQPTLVGRRLSQSPKIERPYPTRRMRLIFNKGPLFYAELNLRLFFFLLFQKTNLFWANDLDTLPANALVAFFRQKPLVYDSHEFFTGVPEIQQKRIVKAIWKWLERATIGRCDLVITVNHSIARLLEDTYAIRKVIVVRNIPEKRNYPIHPLDKAQLKGGANTFYLVLQGNGINVDRGGEELIEAMRHLPDVHLYIIGQGDAMPVLRELVKQWGLVNRVTFTGRLPYEEMMKITAACHLGVSLDKGSNVNYRLSLPNKLFDYATAGLPVLVSDLPELSRLVADHQFGIITPTHDPLAIAKLVKELKNDPEKLRLFSTNARTFAQTLDWNSEFMSVIEKLKSLA